MENLKGRRQVFGLLVLGLVVREAFSFWTGHPTDFELWVRLGYAVNHGGDPYGVLNPVPGLSFANVFGGVNGATIAYLPFWPILTGLIYLVYSVVGWNDRFFYYFLLKQPIIFGDLGLAYLLFSFVRSKRPKLADWVLAFWLFCPFMIILSGIWGMFDSIAIAFVFIALTSTTHTRRLIWTSIGIFAKSIPVIYCAPMLVKRAKDIWAPFVSIGIAALMSAVTFAALGWSFQVAGATLLSTAIKGGWSMSAWDAFPYLNYLGYLPNLTPAVYRPLGLIWIPAIIIFTFVALRRFRNLGEFGLVQSLLVCTLSFLVFKSQVTEQYALYLFAFGLVDVAVWSPTRKWILTGTMGVAMVYLVMNNYFLVRFLSPVYPGFVNFEAAMYSSIGSLRYAVNFLAGVAFTCLNIKYLAVVLKRSDLGV